MSNESSYEFVEDDTAQDAVELARKLVRAGKSKDALVKLLKQASLLLEGLEQASEKQQTAKDLVEALQQKDILKHKDRDVQIRAALCLCHALRLHAPESPYDAATLREIFLLFLAVFGRLENQNDPNFGACHSLLVIAAQTKCCLLILDLEEDAQGMMNDLFKQLLGSVNEVNICKLEEMIVELLTSMLAEADDIPQELLDIILAPQLHPASEENPASARLAEELMRRTEVALQPYLQKFLSSVIDGQPTSSDLKDDCHQIIYQVHRVCPHVLLPILPHMSQELQVNDENRRLAAVQLLGSLFSLPGSDMDEAYDSLFDEFLRRTMDQKVPVRQAALQHCAKVLGNCSTGSSRDKVLGMMEGRLVDYEEKVRGAAVAAICTAASSTPEASLPLKGYLVGVWLLEEVSQRLRDRKVFVRREAAQHLLSVFRAYCERVGDSDAANSEEWMSAQERAERAREEACVMWIPGRLCLAAAKDPELSQHLSEQAFRNGLLPAKLPAPAAARHWANLYTKSSPQEQQAIMRFVRTQTALQTYARIFIQHRAAGADPALEDEEDAGERTPPPHDASKRHLAYATSMIGGAFPDAAKAKAQLDKLRLHRDNKVFKNMLALMEPGLPAEQVRKLAKEVVQRVGSRSAQGEFCRALCCRLAPGLLLPEQLQALLDLLLEGDTISNDVSRAIASLLVDVAAAGPQHFSIAAKKVAQLLDHDDLEMNAVAAKILARSGRHLREAAKDEQAAARLEKMVVTLVQLCQEGSDEKGTTAKAAIRALVNLLQPEEVSATLEGLCREVMDALYNPLDPNLAAKLQTLSGVGRLVPAVFGDFANRLVSFVLDEVLVADFPDEDSDRARGGTWGNFTKGSKTKAFAVKVVARALVPDMPTQRIPAETIGALETFMRALDGILEPLRNADPTKVVEPFQEVNLGLVRLAAASALLRLSRRYDAYIKPASYFTLALAMQDTLIEVRTNFALKVRRAVQIFQGNAATTQRATKYAAMLPMAGADPWAEGRQAAFTMLQEFVAVRRAAILKSGAASQAAEVKGGNVLHEYPEFLLPFLIQILAHHPDCPNDLFSEEDIDEELEPFVKMVQFSLEALFLPGRGPATQPAESMVPAVMKILRTIKNTEDATEEPATPNLYFVADLALAVTEEFAHKRLPGAEPHVKVPGVVSMPKQFFRAAHRGSDVRRDQSSLPEFYHVSLEDGGWAFAPPAPPQGAAVKSEGKPRSKKRTADHTRSAGARSKAARQAAREGPSLEYSRGYTSSIPATTSAAKGNRHDDVDVLSDRQTNATSANGVPASTRATSTSGSADPDFVMGSQRKKRNSSEAAVNSPGAGQASAAKRVRKTGTQAKNPNPGSVSPDFPFTENDASLGNKTPSHSRAISTGKKPAANRRPWHDNSRGRGPSDVSNDRVEAGQHGISTSCKDGRGGLQKKVAARGKLPPQAPKGARAGRSTAVPASQDVAGSGAPHTSQSSQPGIDGSRRGDIIASALDGRRPLDSRDDARRHMEVDTLAPEEAGLLKLAAETAEGAGALALRAPSRSKSEPEDRVDAAGPSDVSKSFAQAAVGTTRGKASPRSRVQKKGVAQGSKAGKAGGADQKIDGAASRADASRANASLANDSLADDQPMGNDSGFAGPSGRSPGSDKQPIAEGGLGAGQGWVGKIGPEGGGISNVGRKGKRRNRELENLLSDMAPNSLDSGPRRRRSSAGIGQDDARGIARSGSRGTKHESASPAPEPSGSKAAQPAEKASEDMDPFALPATQDNDDILALPEAIVTKQGRATRLAPQGQAPAQALDQQPRQKGVDGIADDLRAATSGEDGTGSPAVGKQSTPGSIVAKQGGRGQQRKEGGAIGGRGSGRGAKRGRRKNK